MDFKGFLENMQAAACIISVEKKEEGHGDLRIADANDLFKEAFPAYRPGMFCSDLIPRDEKYEEYCYWAAVRKEIMHAYVEAPDKSGWIDQTILPIKYETEKEAFCAFVFEYSPALASHKRSRISGDVARDVIRICLKLHQNDDITRSMNEVMGDIRRLCDADSCCLLTIDWEQNRIDQFASDFCENHTTRIPVRDDYTPSFFKVVKSWPDVIGSSDCIILKNDSDMNALREKSPELAATLEKANVRSLVLYPLCHADENFGFIWATNFDLEKLVRIKETLELTAFFMACEISNHTLMKKMERMSTEDALTGVMNRMALNQRVTQLKGSGDIYCGIVYADVNGLKRTNDMNGHISGDRLLVNAAGILLRHFAADDIFRVGGDEFVVIKENITREDFEKKVEDLKILATWHDGVGLAIGSSYCSSSDSLSESMREADKKMYDDKQLFYDKHPEYIR